MRSDEAEHQLDKIADEVADGRRVDWQEQRSTDPGLAAGLDTLRALEKMAALMGTSPEVGELGELVPIASPQPMLEPGQALRHFTIEREIGRGGMGIVYLATDQVLDRPVAIKVLPPDVVHSADRQVQFTGEAKLLARLNHPNLATIHGLEEDASGVRFLVLEWVPGETMAARLAHGPLPWREALELCAQIAEGVATAHDRGVIHRDLKPGNVMLTPEGRVKILDFGLARRYVLPRGSSPEQKRGGVFGTLGYVSPECLTQAEDHRADIFAFGCLLYESLTGVPAFPGVTAEEILDAILHRAPDPARLPPDTPAAVIGLIQECVEKDPERRLGSMSEVLRTIDAALGGDHASPAVAWAESNLPRPLTSFVGRSVELARCRELFKTGRLVTLTGSGGSGKTRLAVEVAVQSTRADFPDGVWFAELAPVTDGERVAEVLASALGVREEKAGGLREAIIAHLHPQRALVVLDNCEHVLQSGGELARALLADCPDLRLLATSREALRIPGEHVVPVEPLPVPLTGELIDPVALMRSDAVRLFLDRARLADPGLLPDGPALRAMGEICRRVEGLPLGVELAAARCRVLSPEGIAARLDHQLELLRDVTGAHPDRHHAMRATIAWSVEQLKPEEAKAFRALAVFAGGWELTGAAAVSTDPEDEFVALDLIAVLADKSLVAVEHVKSEASRYRFLEPIRQFALEELAAAGEGAAARRRHLEHFVHLAEAAEQGLLGAEQGRWLARLDREHDNLLAALDECARVPDGDELALRIITGIHRFWAVRGHLRVGMSAIDRALARTTGSTSEALIARGLFARGMLLFYLSASTEEMIQPFSDALTRFRKLGERQWAARCLTAIGIWNNGTGNYAAGRTALMEAREHYEAIGDRRGLGTVLNNLGTGAWLQHDLAGARQLITESMVDCDTGDHWSTAIATVNLAFLAVRLGDLVEGRKLLMEALKLHRELGAKTESSAGALLCAAELEVADGDPWRSAWLFGAADAVLEAVLLKLNEEDPYWHEHDACVARVREKIGEDAYAASYAAGRSVPCQEAIAQTLAELEAKAQFRNDSRLL